MYLLLMITFIAIFISAYILTKLFFNNRGSALIIIISVLLYLLPMIGGALGMLQPHFLVTIAFVTLVTSVLIYIYKFKYSDKLDGYDYIVVEYCLRPKTLEILLVVIPVILSLSWVIIFIVQSVSHKITNYYIPPFSWDVVEYHFPTLVNAVQSGSLWTTFRASWPMGCEMFHSWGFVFLRNDALAYGTHFFFSIILIYYSYFIIHILCFQDTKVISGVNIIAYLIILVMMLVLPLLWDMQFNQIGKNDIALSAFIITALYLYLQCNNEISISNNYGQNILLLGLVLGIISGIKPNGVLYSIFFVGMLLKDSFLKKVPWYSVGVVCLCILLLAGFWYIRPLIMLEKISMEGAKENIVFNLTKDLNFFLTGRDNILFSLSIIFCLIMGVTWHNKDVRMRVANYTLAWSIVIFSLTPFSVWHGSMQLRLAPAIIPLVIIIAIATFLRLIVKTGEKNKACQLHEPNSYTYRRGTILACVSLTLGSVAMVAISLMGGLEAKPRWVWNLRGLVVIGFLAAVLYIYNSAKALKDYQLSISRSLLSVISFFIVVIMIVIQTISYEPRGDLPGYNDNTSVYRWVYQNIQGKTIYLLGLRPYGFYGKEFSNRVINGGDSHGTNLDKWLSIIKQEKCDYIVIGRDYDQHEGWYDYKPFPSDLAKIQSMKNIFKLIWSDNRAMIFSIESRYITCTGKGETAAVKLRMRTRL
jgi:hypothetical protein